MEPVTEPVKTLGVAKRSVGDASPGLNAEGVPAGGGERSSPRNGERENGGGEKRIAAQDNRTSEPGNAAAKWRRRLRGEAVVCQTPRKTRHQAKKAKTAVDSLKVTAREKRVAARTRREGCGLGRSWELCWERPAKRMPAAMRQTMAAGSSVCVPTMRERVVQKKAGTARMQ